MRDPQWLYTWDSKEGMGGLDRISSLLETWGGRASALLFGRNYPPFVPNFGQNVALSRENDHKFESLLRYFLLAPVAVEFPKISGHIL
jgi:hypothetical protein